MSKHEAPKSLASSPIREACPSLVSLRIFSTNNHLFFAPGPWYNRIACVAIVSVGFGSKERSRNGIFGVLPERKMVRETKNPLPRAPFFARAKHPKSSPSAFLCGNACYAGYKVDKCWQNRLYYPLVSDLSGGYCYPPFEQLEPGLCC